VDLGCCSCFQINIVYSIFLYHSRWLSKILIFFEIKVICCPWLIL
jgi:hypothetical protein